MAATVYDQGALVRVTAAFTNSADAAIDPDVVNLSFKNPAGTVVTYVYVTDAELVKDSTGNYHVDIDAATAGTWYYRWWSTGAGQAARERAFDIRAANAI